MSNKNYGKLLAFIGGIIIAFLIIDRLLKEAKISELQKQIDEKDDLNIEIKTKLTELIQNNKDVDPKVANELVQIVTLLEVKQDTSAILKLTKILENLLKVFFKNDLNLKNLTIQNGRKNPTFADYLEHARNENVISKEDYYLLLVMKSIRNEEAHELAVVKHKSKIFAAFIAGLGLVLGLCRLLNKKSIENDKT